MEKVYQAKKFCIICMLLFIGIFMVSRSTHAQCPARPVCTLPEITANSADNIAVAANQTLCISSGTFTGSISNFAGTIYVGPAAVFNPSSFQNVSGKFINCGKSNLPGFTLSGTDTVRISNYNELTFLSTVGFNGKSKFINGPKSKMIFQTDAIFSQTNIVNDGLLHIKGGLTTNGSNVYITNLDSLVADKDISLNGAINNTGYMFANGNSITLNANGVITNGCYFISQGNFVYNGNNDPMIVTGLIWAKGTNVSINGAGNMQLNGGFVQGKDFLNDGKVFGNGNFRFTGFTKHQGQNFGTDGTAASHLNFYDVSPTGNNIFDAGSPPHSSVTKVPVTEKDNTFFVPGTCSIYFNCKNPPMAGVDSTICTPTTTVKLRNPSAAISELWKFASGPTGASVSVDANTGQASGLTQNGEYIFYLVNANVNTCRDSVKITRKTTPTEPITPSVRYFCQGSASSALTPNGTGFTWYAAPKTKLSSAPIPNTSVASVNDYFVTTTVGGCESDTARVKVIVNTSPPVTSKVTGSSVCDSSVFATVTVESTINNVSYQAYRGSKMIGSARTSTADNSVLVLSLPVGGSNGLPKDTSIIIVKAFVNGCDTVPLLDTALVLVDTRPDKSVIITGGKFCRTAGFARVTVSSTLARQVFQVYDGTTPIGSPVTSTTGGTLIIPVPLGAGGATLDTMVLNHNLNVKVIVKGCGVYAIKDTALVHIYPNPPTNLTVVGSTVCTAGSANATVKIISAKADVIYQAYEGTRPIGAPGSVTGSDADLTLILPLGNGIGQLNPGVRLHSIQVLSHYGTCKVFPLVDTAGVIINVNPKLDAVVTASGPICAGGSSAITINPSENFVSYLIYDNGILVDTIPGNGSTAGKQVTLKNVGLRTITVKALIPGCTLQQLDNSASVQVNQGPDNKLRITAITPICFGENAVITVEKPELNVSYQLYDGGAKILPPVIGSASQLQLQFIVPLPSPGLHIYKIEATSGGCQPILADSMPKVVVNKIDTSSSIGFIGDVICSTTDTAKVTITNSQVNVSYQASLGGKLIGSIGTSQLTGSSIILKVLRSELQLGDNNLTITAVIPGCGRVDFKNRFAVVTVNLIPTDKGITLLGDSICETDLNAIAKVENTQAGVSYQVKLGGILIGSIGTSLQTGSDVDLTVKRSELPAHDNIVSLTGKIQGCGTIDFPTKTANLVVNKFPTSTQIEFIGDTICSTDSIATLTVKNTENGVVYQAKSGAAFVGTKGKSTADGATVQLQVKKSELLSNPATLVLTGFIEGCGTVTFTNKEANVLVNSLPDSTLLVLGDSVCFNSGSASITVKSTKSGESYYAYEGTQQIGGAGILSGADSKLSLPIGAVAGQLNPAVISHTLQVLAKIPGCSDVRLRNKAIVIISPQPDTTLDVTFTSPICFGGVTTIKILNAEKGITYSVKEENSTAVIASKKGTGSDLSFQIQPSSIGTHTYVIQTDIKGCAPANLKEKAIVIVNKGTDLTLNVIEVSPICFGDTTTITVEKTDPVASYEVWENETALTASLKGTGGDISFKISNLTAGTHKLPVIAITPGCGNSTLRDTAIVHVNSILDKDLDVIGDTVCSNSDFANVTILKTKKGESYQAYRNGVAIGTAEVSTGTNVILSLPVADFQGKNQFIKVLASVGGCKSDTLNKSALVVVDSLPSADLKIIGDTVCRNSSSAVVTIFKTRKGEKYQAFLNGKLYGRDSISPGGTFQLVIPANGLKDADNFIKLTADITGCSTIFLKDSAMVYVNAIPKDSLLLTGSTVCLSDAFATVQVFRTQPKEIYIVYLENTPLDTAVSTGGAVTLQVPVAKLKTGLNILHATASIQGCSTIDLLDTAGVIVNVSPPDSLKTEGDTVCSGVDFAEVTIYGTQTGQIFQAYESGKKIGEATISTGNVAVLSVPVAGNLSLGLHKIAITATIPGCGVVNLKDTADLLINNSVSKDLEVIGSVNCYKADSATVTIIGTKIGEIYTGLLNGGPITIPTVSKGGDLVLHIALKELKPDTNVVSISVNIKGCGDFLLKNQAKVIVNELPRKDVRVRGDSVCEYTSTAVIKVIASQPQITYQAYFKGQKIGPAKIGNGGLIELPVPVSQLTKDTLNKLIVMADLSQCGEVALDDTAYVKVSVLPVGNLFGLLKGTSVCPGQDGQVSLINSKAGVKYALHVNSTSPAFVTLEGKKDTQTVTLPTAILPNSDNTITFDISSPGCSTVTWGNTANVYVLFKKDLAISGDALLCYHATATFTTNGLIGALSYNWTVPTTNAVINNGQGTDKVSVTFDTTSAVLKITPVGSFGECLNESATTDVRIEAPLRGTGFIKAKDTVCVRDVDTLTVSKLSGATYYKWVWPRDLTLLRDSVKTDSGRYKYPVRYNEAGWRTIIAVPYSACAKGYGDTIRKVVRVLGLPVAEANEYDTRNMLGVLNEVELNGNGSTENGPPADSLIYKWSLEKSSTALIYNSNTLHNAKLLPKVDETKVYLTVTHKNGYCPVKDSAIIKIKFNIDIPNIFSPNNDGVHDTWEILNISSFYPNAVVEVYNKWGSFIWRSNAGYFEPWDGKRNGEDMPVGTYYYIVDRKDGGKPNVGSVTIIK